MKIRKRSKSKMKIKSKIAAAILGFWGLVSLSGEARGDSNEDEAIKELSKLGARFTRAEGAAGKPVIAVYFYYQVVPGSVLKKLRPFSHLQTLNLNHLVKFSTADLRG